MLIRMNLLTYKKKYFNLNPKMPTKIDFFTIAKNIDKIAKRCKTYINTTNLQKN